MQLRKIWISLIVLTIGLTGCQGLSLLEPTPTPVPPTPTPVPPSVLTICLGTEPESLYPYAASSQAARDVLQAVYDGPFEYRDGQLTATILAKVPSYDDGDARTQPVAVRAGDLVANAAGDPVTLQAGTQVFPSGCTRPDCLVTWDGQSGLLLDQPIFTYRLLDGLRWSDGQPLSADDVLFSFELAADPATPQPKRAVDQTAGYNALDAVTVEWLGLPGLVTDDFQAYFWMPLPRHAWGELGAAGLLASEEANRSPLGWGAYMLEEWRAGEFIRLRKNPYYFRAAEGLPLMDEVVFIWIGKDSLTASLQPGESQCDLVTTMALDASNATVIRQAADSGSYQLYPMRPDAAVMLAFGIKPASYDDNYNPYGVDRPDYFGDVRVRQAIAYCLDKDKMAGEMTGGIGIAASSYLSSGHPLLAGLSLPNTGYNPIQGQALLDEAGWKDLDLLKDTPLTAYGTANIPMGLTFEISMVFPDSPQYANLAARIASNLADCGIQVSLQSMDLADLYQPAPDGVIFGRKFDLALLSLQTGDEPQCRWFTTAEIPTAGNHWMGSITGGANFMGYSSQALDASCQQAILSGRDAGSAAATEQTILQLLAAELPLIPLYHHPVISLASQTVCGLPDEQANDFSLMPSIERIGKGGACP